MEKRKQFVLLRVAHAFYVLGRLPSAAWAPFDRHSGAVRAPLGRSGAAQASFGRRSSALVSLVHSRHGVCVTRVAALALAPTAGSPSNPVVTRLEAARCARLPLRRP